MPVGTFAVSGVQVLRGGVGGGGNQGTLSLSSLSLSCIARICNFLRHQPHFQHHHRHHHHYHHDNGTIATCACNAQINSSHFINMRSEALTQTLQEQVMMMMLLLLLLLLLLTTTLLSQIPQLPCSTTSPLSRSHVTSCSSTPSSFTHSTRSWSHVT